MVSRLAFGIGLFALALSSSTALSAERLAPLQIVVSKEQQSLVVYDGDTVVATSPVSTGKPGHDTPTGIFSILEKARKHSSNIYSNAPMPFMQRLTWSGIALHASNHVPAYPASHGCVRLPNDFAATLYKMTRRGLHVIISERQLQPAAIEHRVLFQPSEAAPLLLSDATLRPSVTHLSTGPVEVAMGDAAPEMQTVVRAPMRMLITRRGARETTLDAQMILATLGYYTGPADGARGTQTTDAVKAFQAASGLTIDGQMTSAFLDALYRKAGKGAPPNGQLLVRQSFKPLFEVPVVIDAPEIALGTHFFQFQNIDPATGKGEWFATSLDNALSKATRKRLGITRENDATTFNGSVRTLDRITIPVEVRERINALLGDGSSLTISDQGIGPDTGDGTDFVTITRTE